MKIKATIARQLAADIAINLSATWLAAAFIVPNFLNRSLPEKLLILFLDAVFAIVFAALAYILKEQNNTYD